MSNWSEEAISLKHSLQAKQLGEIFLKFSVCLAIKTLEAINEIELYEYKLLIVISKQSPLHYKFTGTEVTAPATKPATQHLS
jgi:hypothetical protein